MSNAVVEDVKEKARQEIARLVEKYQSLSQAAIKGYTEAQTRRVFIEPLFSALGWDIYGGEEVVEEVKAVAGRVDYVFKLRGVSQFYLEAKPLRAELTKSEYIKQAVTYAYNKGITWVVLTNFEGVRIYNAQTGRPFITLSCDNYLTSFDDLWLLSKESLESNALNERAEKYSALPPRLGIEQRLFNQLRQWRETLFTQLHYYNPHLNYDQIDEVILRLFNRLIFIRTCEDRRIEDKVLLGRLHEWQSSGRRGELIEILQGIFRNFDGYYDSDLFALHLTDDVFIDSVTIEDIIDGLYEVRGGVANYDFSLIDADVLGAVYEQYLGHVATVVKRRAKEAQIRMDLGFPAEQTFELTAKKRRRKEQGIYYTPRFVTDYIVKETVGRFLKERSHNEIINMKILDPACGSGSFLIRAYDELLNYHSDQRGKPVSQLDQWERLPILTGNIYGVDLDMQAVEIARLNLLLRSLARRETLPSLADNIRCGNSLISGTEKELKSYFGNSWREKKPFNWEQEFADIMARGGFDVVIGNPPYVNEARGNKELFRELKKLPQLEAYYEKNMDLFNYFIEIGLDLLKEGGFLGYIIPSYWQDRTGATLLRRKIVQETNIEHLAELGEFKVFAEAPGQHNNIVMLQKVPPHKKTSTLTLTQIDVESPYDEKNIPLFSEPRRVEYGLINNKLIIGRQVLNLAHKVEEENVFYLQKNEIMRGVDTSPSTYQGKGVFVLTESELSNLTVGLRTKQIGELFKPFYKANQIDRYSYESKNNYWLLYTDTKRKELLESNKAKYNVIVEHLDQFKGVITSDNKPYGLHRPKNETNFTDENKILFVRKTPYPKFVTVPIPYFVDESVYLITWHRALYDLNYLLAILNSTLAKWWFGSQKKHGQQLQIDKEQILSFPIRAVDFRNSFERGLHNKLAALASDMLELNKRLAPIRNTPCNERDELLREIERTDKEIDNIVYGLYGLTEVEIKIVEGTTNG
jgi:type I restriction-modification system DNA methylase subunit